MNPFIMYSLIFPGVPMTTGTPSNKACSSFFCWNAPNISTLVISGHSCDIKLQG